METRRCNRVPLIGKAYQVNVTDAQHVEESINEIVKEFNGRLDIFIANAGIPWTQGPMLEGAVDHYRKVVATDLDSTYYCARAAGAHWRRQKKEGTDLNGKKLENYTYGSFVATASMSGHIVNIPQLQAAYNAAKAGVVHLGTWSRHWCSLTHVNVAGVVRSLAVEWVQFARANTVSPGYMATEISDFVPQETKNMWKDKIPMG
jgi:sorbose reductase